MFRNKILINKYSYFKNETESLHKEFYMRKVLTPSGKPTNFFSLEEGIKKMHEESFAFFVQTAMGYKIVGNTFQEHEKCGLQEIEYLPTYYPFFVIQKNLSYKELIKQRY